MTDVLGLAEAFGVTPGSISTNRPHRDPSKLVNAATLLERAWEGDQIARVMVNEALTTSDAFAATVGDIFDRELRQGYREQPAQWSKIGTKTMLKDFNPKKLIDLAGGTASLQKVPEHTNYPEALYKGAVSQVQVEKFGEQFGYTWEMKLADRLDELKQVPGKWRYKAQRTTDKATLKAIANPVTGAPNTGLYNAGNTNLYSGALNAANVQAVMTGLNTRRDENGDLLDPGDLHVVVGPALQFAAQRLFGASEFRSTVDGVEVIEKNPLSGVPFVVMTNLPGDAWFVMPKPGAPRPAVYTAFLVGHEEPQVRYKNDQGRLPGGLEIGIDEGSFDDDTCYWRVRHVVGGAAGDPMFTAAVTGGSGTGALAKTGW